MGIKGLQIDSIGARAVALLEARSKNGNTYGRLAHGSMGPAMRSVELAQALGVKAGDLGSLLRIAVRDGHIVSCKVLEAGGRPTIEYKLGSGLPCTWQPLKPATPIIVRTRDVSPPAPPPDAQPAVASNTGSVPSAPPPLDTSSEGHAVEAIPSAALTNAADGVDVEAMEIIDPEDEERGVEATIARIKAKIQAVRDAREQPQDAADSFRCAIYSDGELVLEVDGEIVRLTRERTFQLCAYLERWAEVPGL